MTDPEIAIQVRRVSKSFAGRLVLDDISLDGGQDLPLLIPRQR